MKPELKQIEADIQRRLPTALCIWDSTDHPAGTHVLDVWVDGKIVAIEITSEPKYGVSLLTDAGLGEGPDQVFHAHEREAMIRHVVELFQPN